MYKLLIIHIYDITCMDVLFLIIVIICLVIGILGSFLPVLPGPPISYLGLIIAQLAGLADFETRIFIIWAIVIVVVTVLDSVLPVWFTDRFGGSKYASWGSVIGLVVGIIFMPPIGMILGPFLGALLGELIHDSNDMGKAFKIATGSFLAFILGTGLKLVVSVWMAIYVLRAVIS